MARTALSGPEYMEHDGPGLAALVARGELYPRELLEAAIARVEAVNPRVNAVCLKLYDQARQEVERGLPEGPFRGVPFLIKDLGLKLLGTVTSAGSRFFQEARAELDSTLSPVTARPASSSSERRPRRSWA